MALAGAAALAIAACASFRSAPDPAQIEREIAASKAAELELVRTTISDPARTERFIDLLAQREQLLKRFVGQIIDHRKRMIELNADYHAERGDFEAQLADYNRKRAIAQQDLVQLITAMKQTTTADEWSEIAAFQLDRLSPRHLAYGGLKEGG
ncbi:MAG: hypothetical protein P8X94_04390 [Woeseiaceae bacterium]